MKFRSAFLCVLALVGVLVRAGEIRFLNATPTAGISIEFSPTVTPSGGSGIGYKVMVDAGRERRLWFDAAASYPAFYAVAYDASGVMLNSSSVLADTVGEAEGVTYRAAYADGTISTIVTRTPLTDSEIWDARGFRALFSVEGFGWGFGTGVTVAGSLLIFYALRRAFEEAGE